MISHLLCSSFKLCISMVRNWEENHNTELNGISSYLYLVWTDSMTGQVFRWLWPTAVICGAYFFMLSFAEDYSSLGSSAQIFPHSPSESFCAHLIFFCGLPVAVDPKFFLQKKNLLHSCMLGNTLSPLQRSWRQSKMIYTVFRSWCCVTVHLTYIFQKGVLIMFDLDREMGILLKRENSKWIWQILCEE